MHANPHLGLALLCERERRFDGGEARTELEHEAVAGSVEQAAPVQPGDAFDYTAERRHLSRRLGLVRLRARRVAGNVERDDRCEPAGW